MKDINGKENKDEEILIKKQWEEEDRAYDRKIIHDNILEKSHQCLILREKTKTGSATLDITLKFYKERLICKCRGEDFSMDYSEILTLCNSPYVLQGRDNAGKMRNLISSTDDEVFDVLMHELSTFVKIDVDKFRTQRERSKASGEIVRKYGFIIAIIVGLGMTLGGFAIDSAMVSAIGVTILICAIGIPLSARWEARKKERQKEATERQKRANPTYMLARRIYALAPSANKYINQIYADTLSGALNNNGNVYEAAALQDECFARKDEAPYEVELSSKQSILDYLDKVLDDPVRPELIGSALISNLDTHFKLSDDLVKVKIKVSLDLFDKTYKNMIREMKGSQKFSADFQRDRYNNSAPSMGLGFGIITSSPSKALLFEAMDNYEREKQEKYKRMEYENNVTKWTGEEVEKTEERISGLYAEFLNSLRTVIKQGI